MTRHMYTVKLIWRYTPLTGRAYYNTLTGVVLATSAKEACELVAADLVKDGSVEKLRAKPRHTIGVAYGETARRCRHDRWDGEQPGEFIPMTLMGEPELRRWSITPFHHRLNRHDG